MQHLVSVAPRTYAQHLSWHHVEHLARFGKHVHVAPLLLSASATYRRLHSSKSDDKPDIPSRSKANPAGIPQSSKRGAQNKQPSNWNIANYITGFRFMLAPVVGGLILHDQNSAALLALSVAGVSDALDGYLARRYGLQTALGATLDPAADKLLIGCATGALCFQGALPMWIVTLVIARDAALIGVASCTPRHKWIEPLPVSKVNTALQITLCVAGIASGGDFNVVQPIVVHGLALATAATTSVSGVVYAVRFWRDAK